MDRALRSRMTGRKMPDRGLSMFDVETDEGLVALLSNIADMDELVIGALMDELKSTWEDEELGMYSALESGYKEPRRYKAMLKHPKEERECCSFP